jgi:hypothetical protein
MKLEYALRVFPKIDRVDDYAICRRGRADRVLDANGSELSEFGFPTIVFDTMEAMATASLSRPPRVASFMLLLTVIL